MFLSLELGRVVTAVTYLVDESDFPVVDADSCDTGHEMTTHRLLPLPSLPLLPVAREPTTSREHADGGGVSIFNLYNLLFSRKALKRKLNYWLTCCLTRKHQYLLHQLSRWN